MFRVPATYTSRGLNKEPSASHPTGQRDSVLRPYEGGGEDPAANLWGTQDPTNKENRGESSNHLPKGKPGTSHNDWSTVQSVWRKARSLTAGKVSPEKRAESKADYRLYLACNKVTLSPDRGGVAALTREVTRAEASRWVH